MSSLVYAQTCCSGGIPISNNIGLENTGAHGLQIGLTYDFNNLNTLNDGNDQLDDDSRKRTTHSGLINAAYGITDKLAVEALVTWVNQRRIISQFGNRDTQSTNGFGDAVVLAKYSFFDVLGASSSLTLGAGTKIPLGSYNERDDDGIVYIADLQPGSGAWDLLLYSSFAKNFDFRPSTTFSGRVIYRETGKNEDYLNGAQTYEYGNEVQVFLGVSDEFVVFNRGLISPNITFKYRKARRDKIDAIELTNTGGDWLFIMPGIMTRLSEQASFVLRAELPLISNVDGTQLTPTYRFTGGLLFNFSVKKKNLLNSNTSQL